MYKIQTPTPVRLQEYYDALAKRVVDLIDEYLNGKVLEYKIPKSIKVLVKVQPGGDTEKALTGLKAPEVLRTLLIGQPYEIPPLIRYVRAKVTSEKCSEMKMSKADYDDNNYPIFVKDGDTYVDHFYTIAYNIFVDGLFEDTDFKLNFTKKAELKFCPYCGMGEVHVAEAVHGVTKPPIDHFLPKSKYPYLAVNFFNLIPSCEKCNDFAHKSSNNPLATDLITYYLMQPYDFDTSQVTYGLTKNLGNGFSAIDYDLSPQFKKGCYYKGYEEWLKLLSRYKGYYADDLQSMLDRMKERAPALRDYLARGYGMPVEDIDSAAFSIIGFHINEDDAWRHERYKLKVDMYNSLKGIFEGAIAASYDLE